jgi:hypothetical protein
MKEAEKTVQLTSPKKLIQMNNLIDKRISLGTIAER